MENFDFNFWTTITLAIFAFLATVIGVYYTRNSYLITLRSYEKDKSRTEKARMYYEKYINRPSSYTYSKFLKKIDSDDLNENVILPSSYTDFLIKNHPDNFFYLASRLRNCHKYFDLINHHGDKNPNCKIKHFNLLQWFFFILYLAFGILAIFLILSYSKIITSFSTDNFWGVFYLTTFGILCFLGFMLICLFKTTQISNAKSLVKDLGIKRITYKDDLRSIINIVKNTF